MTTSPHNSQCDNPSRAARNGQWRAEIVTGRGVGDDGSSGSGDGCDGLGGYVLMCVCVRARTNPQQPVTPVTPVTTESTDARMTRHQLTVSKTTRHAHPTVDEWLTRLGDVVGD